MRCTTYEEARKQAQDNANRTGKTWCAFFDASGNANCERADSQAVHRELFYPHTQEDIAARNSVDGDYNSGVARTF